MTRAAEMAERIFRSALVAADPYRVVERHADDIRVRHEQGGFTRLLVLGFGKAACAMARAVEERLGDLVTGGLVITRHGHDTGYPLAHIKVREAGHPLPDVAGMAATEELLRLTESATAETLVLVLVSGGGSSLLVAPWPGLTLADKQATTGLLLKSGATIDELNCVRKHLSRVKGGRLAGALRPATTISLILSDVIGDRPEVIASGPTAPDAGTFADALKVLDSYRLAERVPPAVLDHLRRGRRGDVPETLKEGDAAFDLVENRIVGSNRQVLTAAAREAEAMGLRAEILADPLNGEAREAGVWLAWQALAARGKRTGPLCLLAGGETTVTVRGLGKGGRNQELALAFAMEIAGLAGITLLSAGTDGIDGPTDAAGAIVDGDTVPRSLQAGVAPEVFLAANDSYRFFSEQGGLLVTGPTGTNVMDLQVVVMGE
jgi:glycerate 2-kinase